MAVPWLRLLDAALGMTDLVRSRRQPSASALAETEAPPLGSRALGHLETRLAGVVVAALKEAFDRDSRRLEFEREHLEAERQRAERALKLELLRQAADREIGRLRLLAGAAIASWLGTLFFSARLLGGPPGAKIALGSGWLLLLGAVAAAFTAQSSIGRLLGDLENLPDVDEVSAGAAGTMATWLIVIGLALVGLSVLLF